MNKRPREGARALLLMRGAAQSKMGRCAPETKKPSAGLGFFCEPEGSSGNGKEPCYVSGANIADGFAERGVNVSHRANLLRRRGRYGRMLNFEAHKTKSHKGKKSNSAGYEQSS